MMQRLSADEGEVTERFSISVRVRVLSYGKVLRKPPQSTCAQRTLDDSSGSGTNTLARVFLEEISITGVSVL